MSENEEKPKNFGEAFKKHVGDDVGDKLTPDEKNALGVDEGGDEADDQVETQTIDESGIPDWAVLPPDLKLPPGRKLYFMRFRSKMTDVPGKGDRWCVMWNLTVADEKQAMKRTRGEGVLIWEEMSKQMIRCVDGQKVDWSTGAPMLVRWWDEIGSKCRSMVKNTYQKTHNMDADERADFFMNCFAVRNAVVG